MNNLENKQKTKIPNSGSEQKEKDLGRFLDFEMNASISKSYPINDPNTTPKQ